MTHFDPWHHLINSLKFLAMAHHLNSRHYGWYVSFRQFSQLLPRMCHLCFPDLCRGRVKFHFAESELQEYLKDSAFALVRSTLADHQ